MDEENENQDNQSSNGGDGEENDGEEDEVELLNENRISGRQGLQESQREDNSHSRPSIPHFRDSVVVKKRGVNREIGGLLDYNSSGPSYPGVDGNLRKLVRGDNRL